MKTIYHSEYKKIIKKLKAARAEAELTQMQVCNILKWNRNKLQKIETQDRRMDIIELLQLGNVYKKPINYFLEGINIKIPKQKITQKWGVGYDKN